MSRIGISIVSCGAVNGSARDDLHGVIDAHFFKPRIEGPKEGRLATARYLQRLEDALRSILSRPHCSPLRVDKCGAKTDAAGMLELASAHTLSTLYNHSHYETLRILLTCSCSCATFPCARYNGYLRYYLLHDGSC